MADLTQDEWVEQMKNDQDVVVLDVRTEEEIEAGHIPHAINLDIYDGQGFLDELEKLDKSKSYYVYCRSGARSAQACALMDQLQFKKAYNLVGGFMDWKGEVVIPE